MKRFTFTRWDLMVKETGGYWSLLLLLVMQSQAALAISTPGNSATLDELLLPGANLLSLDGSVEFDNFSLTSNLPDLNAPEPSEVLIEVISPVNMTETVLQFRILGAAQILQDDEAYQLEINYQANSLSSEFAFSEVSLNIEGATLGTAGSGLVQIDMDIFAPEVPQELNEAASIFAGLIGQLSVVDDGDGDQVLMESKGIHPPQFSLQIQTTINVQGGSDSSSGAVLTDLEVGFQRTEIIPEPGATQLVALAAGLFLLLFRHRIG